jgi:hypothetical protein
MNCFSLRGPCCGAIFWILFVLSAGADSSADHWHSDLYVGGGDYWRQRIRIEVTNLTSIKFEGEPLELYVGNSKECLSLVEAKAEAIRVCDKNGVELLWTIYSTNDNKISKGKIPNGARLIIPISLSPFSGSSYYVYFDNPSAWSVPDYYDVKTYILNSDVEQGENGVPSFWQQDKSDDAHRNYWVNENPHSGKKCLKTVVSEGATPSWISTRQYNIRIHPGSRYKFSGFVRAQNVRGSSGWFIHVGNRENPILLNPMITVSEGTFDWREVSAEFIAPTNADRISVGTVLYGTGTAWFDDARLELVKSSSPIKIVSIDLQRLPVLKEVGSQLPWTKKEKSQFLMRLPLRLDNIENQRNQNTLISADLSPVITRYSRFLNLDEIYATDYIGKPIDFVRVGKKLFIFSVVEPFTRMYNYVYFPKLSQMSSSKDINKSGYQFTPNPALPNGDYVRESVKLARAQYLKLLNSPVNLVKNADFELGLTSPDFWTIGGVSGNEVTIQSVDGGLFSKRFVSVVIKNNQSKAWIGLRQTIPVKSGREYFYSCWVRCSNVVSGSIKLHAHAKNLEGQVCKEGGYLSVGEGVGGNQDWTLLSGVCIMPSDAQSLELHLTTDTAGEISYDGVVLAEVNESFSLPIEWNPESNRNELFVWQVPSIVKVFRDDMPCGKILSPRINAAKNEREPLQLAIRSPENLKLQIKCEPPRHPSGGELPQPEIGIVGYVPIDFVSGYYQSNLPEWIRKKPARPGGSDGWAGYWPDPIFPTNYVELEANQTQPVWITFKIPKDAKPGDYFGTLKLVCNNKILKEIPYSVHIWNFELPEKRNVKAIYDVRATAQKWALDGTSEEELRKAVWAFMAERRLCPDTIRPEPRLQYKEGRVEADFSDFDRNARYYIEELQFAHFYTPYQFYCFGWGLPPSKKFGEAPYDGKFPYENVDREDLRPQFKQAYQKCLKVYWDHLKTNGWSERCLLYISDEPFDHMVEIKKQMKALCRMIHEVDPEIRIYSSTWHHQPEWDGYITVWGLGHYGIVSSEKLEQIRNTGARILWTTDGQMCIDTPFLAIERLLPHYAFHYGAEGYEFWGFDWLTYDPYEFGWHSFIRQSDQPGKSYWVRYPNGDGYLIYPGNKFGSVKPIPSLRSELAAEGCEDYEYLYLLKQLTNKNKPAANEAEQAIEFARTLVFMPNAGGRFSSLILPNPERVYEAREKIARAIEELSK